MAWTIPILPGTWRVNATATGVNIFGVRHLSPGGAWHLRGFLEKIQPTIVLVEAIADATNLIPQIVDRKSRPPLAILAFTDQMPVQSFVTPFAEYCPEYQALLWARSNRVEARFIDLPATVFLGLHRQALERKNAKKPEEIPPDPSESSESSAYERLAALAGEPDYETWWERRFEHSLQDDSYRQAAAVFGTEIRALRGKESDETLLREAHMRREINRAIADGHAPGKIVVVVGAAHVPAILNTDGPMGETELAAAPVASIKLTLMPYSNFKLSAQSGYGAGNHAPAYFEMLWHFFDQDRAAGPANYLTQIARTMRTAGTHRSAAEVIDAVRLAESLAGLRDSSSITLTELHDAAITIFGRGEAGVVAEAFARIDIGTRIGSLASGVSQTSIQEDFSLQMQELKLSDYRSTVAQDLRLDLRENRRAKTEASAFLDLRRSAFLHRLRALNIPFVKLRENNSNNESSWAEAWILQWTPECEISLVESVLLGERVDVAAGYALARRIDAAASVEEAASVVRIAGECDLPSLTDRARARVQALASGGATVAPLAKAASELGRVIRFGDVRRIDPKPLEPLLVQLHLQATLQVFHSAVCDHAAAMELVDSMATLDALAQEHHTLIEESRWLTALQSLSEADDRNALCSGFACALLCERGGINDEALGREVSRRLSPGISADLGAGWFEGLARRNRYALLSRMILWQHLDNYLAGLDATDFTRALVFLRRAFSGFAPGERRAICENLGQLWQVSADQAEEVLSKPLDENENKTLESLSEFDFGDLS